MDKEQELAEKIVKALNDKGAGLGNFSVLIVQSVIEEAAQQKRAADGLPLWECSCGYHNWSYQNPCSGCGINH